MKRLLSVVLCFVLIACSISLFFSAAAENAHPDPVIICQGYAGVSLIKDKGTPDEKMAWHVDVKKAFETRKQALINSIAESVKNNSTDAVVNELGTAICEELEYMRVNPDGSSVYNLSVFSTEPAETNMKAMKANGNTEYMGETTLAEDLAKEIGEENIFMFQEDWRMSQMVISQQLDTYIKAVLAYTGASKVRLFGLSHGGQIVTFYLNRYGLNGLVSKAVVSVPATCGTYLLSDVLTLNKYNFDISQIADFAEKGFGQDLDFELLLKAFDYPTINEIFRRVVQEYGIKIVQYFGSVWDFVPSSEYESMKAKFLTDPACAPLIATVDESHYTYLANTSSRLQAVKNAGTEISIVAGTNHELASGTQKNSDYIIDVTCCTGAVTAALGKTFDSGYTQQGTQCSDKSHYHISPGFDIDASTCYLPDNTWFALDDYHGFYSTDTYTMKLIEKLLLTDDIKDVYTDKNYPQFSYSIQPGFEVWGKFDNSALAYHTDGDLNFIITNIAAKNSETITSVKANGAEITFNLTTKKLNKGESLTIPITALPIETSKPFNITITYFYNINNVPTYRTRTMTFMQADTAMAAEYPYLVNVTNTPSASAVTTMVSPAETTTVASAAASAVSSVKNPKTDNIFANNNKPFLTASAVATAALAAACTIVTVRRKKRAI